ncbi:hypothetical protein ANCCEY_04982 [Ancylostoma ceylanicum]|uniref:Uncharacterized protein n=1 Tax=Ancylostoma ceylanicum TaxID=53326 RepID=A0A0D6M0Q3_9BILA|nr:hypothetical protein ANCCEY_04982 [Ancylostoma ceylanicum]
MNVWLSEEVIVLLSNFLDPRLSTREQEQWGGAYVQDALTAQPKRPDFFMVCGNYKSGKRNYMYKNKMGRMPRIIAFS